MQIWAADFVFELTAKPKDKIKYCITVFDVVALKVPQNHIHKKTNIVARAVQNISDTSLLAKDNLGRYKVKVQYKKRLGYTNGSSME